MTRAVHSDLTPVHSGANAVFADGSVHFLRANVSIKVQAALITRASGEVASDKDY
jgi:prepilin-type processing-associated H-X9-DG protein